MSDPGLELQKAVFDLLSADPEVTAIVAARIYDQVPTSAQMPYVSIGDDQVVADKFECVDGAETFLTLHAWSKAVGHVQVKQLSDAIVGAINDADPPLPSFHLLDLALQDVRRMTEPDGLTQHAVITFRAVTDPS